MGGRVGVVAKGSLLEPQRVRQKRGWGRARGQGMETRHA